MRRYLKQFGGWRYRAEPEAAMFLRLRTRLTLWYTAVLAGALLLFGITLYLVVQQTVYNSVQHDLAGPVHLSVLQWENAPLADSASCLPVSDSGQPQFPHFPSNRFNAPYLFACYNTQGIFIQGTAHGDNGQVPSTFLQNSLAHNALQAPDGQATDVIGSANGPVYRYAVVVHSSLNGSMLGVVEIGEVIKGQTATLQILLFVLIFVGVLTLIAAAFGGLFLANRALAPARLAMERQQRFIADASHELRTPLTLMRADAEVLLRSRERFDPEDAALLEDIVAESTHMTTLASSMLTLARIDAGQQHQEKDIVDLSKIAEHVTRRASALAEQKHVILNNASTAPVLVIGDATLFEQAALVILDNAIKYNHPDGHVTITTCATDEQALFVIQDTGIGIPEDHIPHMGERFYRVDKARSREAGGTGLGLSIARSIVNTHNGTVEMASSVGQGTRVTISLPLARHVKS